MAKTPEIERIFEKPVAWLVGRDLLGGIKGIILYTAYGSKLDPRDWMSGKVVDFRSSIGDKKEFWFDYIADAGDGTKAMYAIAYMTLTDLWQKASSEPAEDGKRGIAFEEATGRQLLPRGEFLFFGGDTAYHVADYLTLGNRIQRPFTYAFEDLREHGEIPQRPVFGIPGNHDYYDQVDGFRRQFRKPVRDEPPQPPHAPGGDHAQLGLAGFDRVQEASYVALKLPFGWWLWGLDTETGPLDNRQQKFFADITDTNAEGEVIPPRKLILATSSPSTIFGKVADEESDFKATQALKSLFGDDQPFLPAKRSDGTYDFSVTGDARMKSGECRLDISGDVHHYARYWGPSSGKAARERSKSTAPKADHYASVVSGLGGAFHHPSNTYDDELQEQVLWPTEKESRQAVGNQVFDFRSIWTGGYVWLFGFIIAFVVYFALSVTQSSRQDLSNLGPLPWLHLGIVQQEPIRPTTGPGTADYFFITAGPSWPKDLTTGTILILLSVVVTFVTFFIREWLFGPANINFKDAGPPANPFWKLFTIVTPTAAAIMFGMIAVGRYRDHITPFVSSLMVLFTIIVAAGGVVLTVRYNDYLFQKGHYFYITDLDRFWPWVLPVLSVLVFAVGLLSFGRNNVPALLISDIVFTLVFVIVVVALVVLPFKASGELLYTKSRWLAYPAKAAIGIWHAILQLAVPFVLIRKGNWLTWVLAAILLAVPIRPAAKLFKNNRRLLLSALWFIYGAIILTLPWLVARVTAAYWGAGMMAPFSSAAWLGTAALLPSVLAGVTGAVMSCLWFGWYLGICSILNGHNNEIGGAARIESFKEFIRFRLDEEGLTGYVIGVDDVSIIGEPGEPGTVKDGRDLRLKLIDKFHLEVKR